MFIVVQKNSVTDETWFNSLEKVLFKTVSLDRIGQDRIYNVF